MLIKDGDLEKLWRKGKEDPVFWSREIIGDTLYDKQEETLYSVRDNVMTSVAAAHGVGKTFIASRAAAWFLTTFKESIVVTTAPTDRQVKALLWSEINRLAGRAKFPLARTKPLTKSWEIDKGWFAIGLSTDDPNKFQGFHPGSGRILVIADEAAGLAEIIFKEGVDALLTSELARLLMIGNPTEPSGRFYESHHGASKHLYHRIKISAFDTPNLKAGKVLYPYLVTPQWVEHRGIIWGKDSSAYQSRVEANFPAVGTSTLIPAAWVDISFFHDWAIVQQSIEKARVATLGVDVARFGDDLSAVAVRRGRVVTRQNQFYHLDTVKLAREVARIADEECIGTPTRTSPHDSFIVVDATGVGAGVADWLRDKGYKVIDFQGGERAFLSTRYADRRAEAWWGIRERFRTKDLMIPALDGPEGFFPEELCDKLRGQFSGLRYKFDKNSRYVLESKEEMKKRLAGKDAAERGDAKGKSPDEAEAIIHAFAFDSSADTAIAGDDDDAAYEAAKVEAAKSVPDSVAALFDRLRRERELDAERDMFEGG